MPKRKPPEKPETAMVVITSPTEPTGPEIVLCPSCGGPALLCGGVDHCRGLVPPEDHRWLTAIRALYAGLLLVDTEASLWGGALIRLARQLGTGPAPAGMATVAGAYADPRSQALSGAGAAHLALAYFVEREPEPVFQLQNALRTAKAGWFAPLWFLASDAVRATPLQRARFNLLAARCNDCAEPRLGLAGLAAGAETFDDAIRCPVCGAVPAHPLPWVKIGEPHPVSRCVCRPPEKACLVHAGEDLDGDGLCARGRTILEDAVAEARAARKDPAFVQAMQRARQLWMDSGGPLRALMTSEDFGPVFAAVAKGNAGARKAFEDLTGQPLDLDKADPAVLAEVEKHGGNLNGIIEAGFAAVRKEFPVLARLFGEKREPKALGEGRKPRRSRRKVDQGETR